ncbi:hypothetical protein D3C72_2391610 [compost metagenome]
MLLGKLRQVTIAGDANHLETLRLDSLRQRADTEARGVLGTIVFIDDDDGKAKLHAQPPCNRALPGQKTK